MANRKRKPTLGYRVSDRDSTSGCGTLYRHLSIEIMPIEERDAAKELNQNIGSKHSAYYLERAEQVKSLTYGTQYWTTANCYSGVSLNWQSDSNRGFSSWYAFRIETYVGEAMFKVVRQLERAGIVEDMQPHEVQTILDRLGAIPIEYVSEGLHDYVQSIEYEPLKAPEAVNESQAA